MNTAENLQGALWDANELPNGPSRLQAVSTLVAAIQADGAEWLQAEALNALVESYTFDGAADRAVVPFAQALRLYDTRPELFDAADQRDLLWSFKWLAARLAEFPTVGRAQIEATLDDMARRYTEAGTGQSAVYGERLAWALHLRDRPAIRRWLDAVTSCPQDDYSDCAACLPAGIGSALAALGDDVGAVRRFAGVIDGNETCRTEPMWSCGASLAPLVRLGRLDEARRHHRRGLAAVRADPLFVEFLTPHLRYLAMTGSADRGRDLVVEHVDQYRRVVEPYSSMLLRAASAGVLDRAGTPDVEVPGLDGATTVGALAAGFRSEALTLAAAFDRRNGSTVVSERVADLLDPPDQAAG